MTMTAPTNERAAPGQPPRRRSGTAPWPVVLCSCSLPCALCAVRHLPDRPEHPIQRLRLERPEPLTDWVGLQNFRDAFADPIFVQAISHNFIIIGLSLLLQIPFAVALAVLLSRNLKGRGVFRTMYFAPFILSEVVTGVVWRQISAPMASSTRSLAPLAPAT